jgi:glucose/arabinose dehydrogenase
MTLALAAVFSVSPAAAQAPPFALGGDPRVDPADFRVTLFASGLTSPLPMQALADGSLLVGTNVGLVRLLDADQNGVADGPGTTLYAGGSGLVTGLRVAGGLAFMARGQTIRILRLGATPGSPLVSLASFLIEIPFPWSHISPTLAVRETEPDLFELYFNMGSKQDDAATTVPVPVSGAVTGSLQADSIYRVVVDDRGPSLALSGLERIAAGVRNAFGIAFHPGTGDLWFEDNSIDGPDPPYEVSADELNLIPAAQIGGGIEDFGFPDNYIAYRTGIEVGSGGIDPVLTFQPIPPPNGSESEGPAEISFAPPGFPVGLREGVFVGFHGAFSTAGVANTDNPLVYVDLDTLEYFHIIENDEPGIGHLDGLLATQDSLFLADFTSQDGFVVPGAGRIYQIKSLVAPAAVPTASPGALAWLVSALAIAGAARAARARRGRRAQGASANETIA